MPNALFQSITNSEWQLISSRFVPRAGLKVRNPYWMSTHCCGKRENMSCELAFRHSPLKISFRELRFNHFYNRNSDLGRHVHCVPVDRAGRAHSATAFSYFHTQRLWLWRRSFVKHGATSPSRIRWDFEDREFIFPRVDPLFIFHVCTSDHSQPHSSISFIIRMHSESHKKAGCEMKTRSV